MPLTIGAGDEEWISLEEVRTYANITTAGNDDELYLMLGAAQDAVEGLVGPVLWRTVTDTVPVTGGIAVLRHNPVVSVASVTASDQAVTYTLNADAGLLTGLTTTSDVTVSYVAGRAVVSDALRQATLIIAGHLWETQRGNAPSSLQPEEFGTQAVGVGYAIPNRAADLLAPYLLGPGIA